MPVYILHENPAWLPAFGDALDAAGLGWEAWMLDGGTLDLDAAPPEGVFWSRMSASAATRGHDRAIAHTRAVLDWLEAYGRRVVNGRTALELEVSKAAQHLALQAAGIATPRSVAVVGDDPATLIGAAAPVPAPLVVKPNRGGTGWGVQWLPDHAALAQAAHAGTLAASPDGVRLVQEYVDAPAGRITRVELVGGRFVYAVDVDTSSGFELCPADACRPGDGGSLFSLRADVDPQLVSQYETFALEHGLEVVAFEHVESPDGRRLTYDINTNTNYSPDIEAVAPRSGPGQVARLLADLLHADHAPAPSSAAR